MRPYPELTYARPGDRLLKRLAIGWIEDVSGRRLLARLYGNWRSRVAAGDRLAFNAMLDVMRIRLDCRGTLPEMASLPPHLVMVANHPFGIGDGIAMLALAERLGRPYRILVNNDLMKIPEMAAYGLPVSFEETRQAQALNLATRREAMRLLSEGTTIVIFPAGGVATAPTVFGAADDLPWKQFTARLVQSSRAAVLPVHFCGQNGPLFHLVSRWSLTLRLGLLIGEFRRLYGRAITVTIGDMIFYEEIAAIDRRALTDWLREMVFGLASQDAADLRAA